MSNTIVLVSKDNQRIPVSRALLKEMSLLMNSLLSYESDSLESPKKEEIEIQEFSGDVLRIVVDYMNKKKELGHSPPLDAIPIREDLLLDVIAAAAFFQC
ncbi:hypothetical protein WA538_002286, partial [Blastocystis sp. DL]